MPPMPKQATASRHQGQRRPCSHLQDLRAFLAKTITEMKRDKGKPTTGVFTAQDVSAHRGMGRVGGELGHRKALAPSGLGGRVDRRGCGNSDRRRRVPHNVCVDANQPAFPSRPFRSGVLVTEGSAGQDLETMFDLWDELKEGASAQRS